MKYTRATTLWLLPVLAGLFLYRCTGSNVAGGSGSTTTNGFTAAIVNKDGVPVAAAKVTVRPSDYLAGTTEPHSLPESRDVVDTFTNAHGFISIGGLLPGSYVIELQDTVAHEGTVIRARIADGPLVKLGKCTTAPHGSLGGSVDSTLLRGGRTCRVHVYGLERSTAVDSAKNSFLFTGLAPGTYDLRLTGDDSLFKPVDIDSVICVSGDTIQTDPFALWAHQAKLTIDYSSVNLEATDTILDFPLLLRLTSDNFDFSTAKKKGGDLRVAKSDGSLVTIDADWWDSANATALIWISIDTVIGSQPQDTLSVFWGNQNILSVSQPQVVFDTAAGFHGVWHLNESGGTEQKDATVNNRSGTPETMDGSNDITGHIGRAQRFDGDNRIDFPAGSSIIAGEKQDAASFSAWIKVSSVNDSDQSIIASSSQEFDLLHSSRGAWVFRFTLADGSLDTLSAPASLDTWTFISVNRSGASRYLFVNGEIADSSSGTTSSLIDAGDGNFILGSSPDANRYFTGSIDELRMYRVSQSASWIKLCYESQRSDQQVVTLQKIR